MKTPEPSPTLPARDRLLSRPDEPLPVNPDPHCPRDHPTDPKPQPPTPGKGIDPHAEDIDHVA
jgi:hypothetical protein